MKKILAIITLIIFTLGQFSFNIVNAYYGSDEKKHPEINFMNKENPTENEEIVDSFVKSIMDPLAKKVVRALYQKRFKFIKKYGVKEGYDKYIAYLNKIKIVIGKLKDNLKYKKYKQTLISIYFILEDFIKIVRFDYGNGNGNGTGNNNISNNNNNNTNSNNPNRTNKIENTNNFINIPTVKLDEGIENYFKIEKLMKQDVVNYNKDYNKTWGNIENTYPQIIKNFTNYLNRIIAKSEDKLKKDSVFTLEQIVLNNINKYNKRNTQLDFKLSNIDRQALKKTIDNIEKGNVFIPDQDYKILLEQSAKAEKNLKNIILNVLNKNVNRLILLKKGKEDGTYYFGNNLKIYVDTWYNGCIYDGGDYKNTSEGIRKMIRRASMYSSKYFTFYYYQDENNIRLRLYNKKSQKCINDIAKNINIYLPNNDLLAKKKILANLGAKYLLNTYNNWIEINNRIYSLFNLSNNVKNNTLYNDTTSLKSTKDIITKNLFIDKNLDKKYLSNKEIPKYYQTMLLVDENRNDITKKYVNKYHFMYIGEKDIIKNDLYYFNFMLNFILSKESLTGLNIINNYNINPNDVKKWQLGYIRTLKDIYDMVYNNNFKTLKDIYLYIAKNYKYDYKLYNLILDNKSINRNANIKNMLNKKKGICQQNSMLLSLITAFYGIPSGYIELNTKDIAKYGYGHAVSIIDGNIYDITYDIGKGTLKGFGHTFVSKPNNFYKYGNITIYYPRKLKNLINKKEKIFQLKNISVIK